MSKDTVFDALSLTGIAAFAEATEKFLKKNYSDTIQHHIAFHGYKKRKIRLTDPRSVKQIKGKARKAAKSIVQTYNRMLQNQLKSLPDDLTDDQYKQKLQPFIKRTKKYDAFVLTPFLVSWAQQRATQDFYIRNGINVQWTIRPPRTDQNDLCREAIDLSPMSLEQAMKFDFPAHPRCPHRIVPVRTSSATLPNEENLWTGEAKG